MTLTIAHLAPQIRDGRLSAADLLRRCLARLDATEPRVRAWVLVDRERAMSEAQARDDERKAGRYRGPLHGIPVGIKDIFDVFDWPTACGSTAWAGSIARHDAPAVRRLRDAGCVLMGKTVTTAFASFDPGPTRNPWDATRTPGGSSSGSAAAVALGQCVAALGSQTGGSITRPASYCGVPGCKPTFGTVSTQGVMPLAESMDHVGPIGRCVHDVALLLQTIADVPAEWASARLSRPPVLGRLRGLFERLADAGVNAMMERECAHLASRGAILRDVALPAAFADVVAQHRIIMAVESAAYHAQRLRRRPEDYPRHITSLVGEGVACSALDYAAAKGLQASLRPEMAALLASVDALICPATTRGAPDAASTGDPAFNSPWSFTGLPVVSVPTALDGEGLPLGVQLVGAAGGEGPLFATAAWCEANRERDIGEPPFDKQ